MRKIYPPAFRKASFQKGVFTVLFLTVLLVSYSASFAQYKVIRTESFDGVTYPPFGWIANKISGSDLNNYTERVTAGTAPVCAPRSGAGMMRYRSGFMFNAGEQYFVASPRYDLTNNPGTATVSFWLYRDNLNAINDSVTLYVNNNQSANASRQQVIGPISRASGLPGAWVQYTAIIPAGWANSNVYFVFVFTNRETAAGANIYMDDFAVETYPKPQLVVSSQLFYQEIADINKGATDQMIVGIKVTCDGAGDSARVDSIVTNCTGTTLLTDLVNPSAKLWYTKGTSTFNNTAANQFGVTLTPTLFRDKFTQANFFLENGDNYFWVTLSTTPGAIGGDYVDVDFNGIYYRKIAYAGADTSRIPTVSAVVGARQIDVSLCGGVIPTMFVGTSWLNGSYTNNDYIARVWLKGANSVTPAYSYIDNNTNDVGPAIAPWFSGPAPFTVFPPSYQQMPATNTPPLHPNVTAVLVQGASYATPIAGPIGAGLALQCGTWSSSNYMAAWIDFNKDGDLMDAGEQIVQSGSMSATTWWYAPVNVPPTLTPPTPNIAGPSGIAYGNVKMRVREVFAVSNIQPCQSGYTYGEIEDYIVTIIPSCPAGVKLWLGYTNDWNTPSNWCGGVPTIADVALIDEVGYLGGTQTGAPFDPVINTGTIATAKTIRISSTDTLTVNSPTASSLQIADSLTISYNGAGGKMIVQSAYSDTAQLSNGALAFNFTPFKRTVKNSRAQLIYTKAELLAKGMLAGDYIDQLKFYLRANVCPASNFNSLTIKYATVLGSWGKFPPPGALPGNFGTAGSVWAPNLTAYTTVYTGTLAFPANPTSLVITLNPNSMVWNGVDDIILEICFDLGALSTAGFFDLLPVQTQTTGTYQFAHAYINNTVPSGCTLGAVSGTNGGPPGQIVLSAQYRPNVTWVFRRPYTKFPINMTGNGVVTAGTWVNNGLFTAGRSIVTFSNALQGQQLTGSSITTFSDLAINKTGALATQGVLMVLNANVDSSVALTAGYLNLNQRTLTINNPIPAAATRTSGWILSETVSPNYGIINWKIGTNNLLHTFPFGTTAGGYIPVEFTNSNAVDKGTVSIATYRTTTTANIPYPAAAGPFGITVQHMRGQATGTDISITDVVDRFWQINKSTLPVADNAVIKFTYVPGVPAAGEEPAPAMSYTAQKFMPIGGTGSITGGWKNKGGTAGAGSVTATIVADSINGPWTLSNLSNPLPIELLDFDAKLVNDKVKVWWSTASEMDNDYFTVERTVNGNDFDFISTVKSKGNSTVTQNYETYDHSPVVGLQYYRLKTTDLEGQHEYSKMVPVKYAKDGVFAINAINANYSSNALDVMFTYDSNEPFTYSVVDILGRTLVSKNGNAGYPGLNTVSIPVSMNKGVYFVVIENKTKKVASKIVY